MSTSHVANTVERQECWKLALEAFGTKYIFEKRAAKLRRQLNLLTFFGIAVPATVGAIVLSFSAVPSLLPYVLTLAGILGVAQVVVTVWSVVYKWQDELVYASESINANDRLSSSFAWLGKTNSAD